VQSAEDRLGSDRVRFPAALARIGLSDVANGRGRTGNTRTERHVRTGSVVMGGPHSQDGPQMRFGQRYQPIQTLAPNGYGWHQDMLG